MKKLLLIAVAILCVPLSSCETLSSWQSNPMVQFAEMQAIKLAQSYFNNGGNTDTAWGISNGLNLIGDIASFSLQQKLAKDAQEANALAADKLKAQVKAFADDKTAVNGLANGIASVVNTSKAQTPEERAKITLAIANGIQSAITFGDGAP